MPLKHIDHEFEEELDHIRVLVTRMGQAVETMLADGFRAFETRDAELASRIILADAQVDRLEVETDNLCLRVLARWQPVASDLRFVTAAMRLVTDVERIGDLCVNLCERTVELAQESPHESPGDLSAMALAAQRMLREALRAFTQGDCDLAGQVMDQDRHMDALCAQVFRQLLNRMTEDRASVSWATRVQAVAKYLERVGDHATNLAETAVFMVQGRDIRHPDALKEAGSGAPRGILFLCVRNAARSQMAEGWARKLLPPEVTIWSAGSDPASAVDPKAVEVMQEIGINIASQHPKRISDVPLGGIDTVITLCAEEVCVTLPGLVRREAWVLPDPAAAMGEPQEVDRAFRSVRDELRQRVGHLAQEVRQRQQERFAR